MSREPFEIVLSHAQALTSQVRHLTFERRDGHAFSFVPGQFITLHLEHEGTVLPRSYSVANPVPSVDRSRNTRIEFAVSAVPHGVATARLFGLSIGDALQATGPFGRLILPQRVDDMPERLVLVATGTGVTPYRAMLPDLASYLDHPDRSVVLLLGVRHRADRLYADEFLDMAKRHPRFAFHVVYSRETQVEQPWERLGYVQDHFEALAPRRDKDWVYLCGNPNMVDAAYARLLEQGLTVRQVRREKYISSKVATPRQTPEG